MKPFLLLTIIILILAACSQNTPAHEPKEEHKKSDQTIWYVAYESLNPEGTLKRSKCLDTLEKTPEKLIDELNAIYPKVGLEFINIKHDTIFVNVMHSTVLTESMGTTGAEEFCAIATFTLTEIPSINKVYFEMQDGSHAGKGARTRVSFKNVFEIVNE